MSDDLTRDAIWVSSMAFVSEREREMNMCPNDGGNRT